MTTTITETQSQTATQSEPSPEPMGSESGTEVSQPLGEQQTTPASDTQSSVGVVGSTVTSNTVATNLQGNLQQMFWLKAKLSL